MISVYKGNMSAKSNAQAKNDAKYDIDNSDFVKLINETLKDIGNIKW